MSGSPSSTSSSWQDTLSPTGEQDLRVRPAPATSSTDQPQGLRFHRVWARLVQRIFSIIYLRRLFNDSSATSVSTSRTSASRRTARLVHKIATGQGVPDIDRLPWRPPFPSPEYLDFDDEPVLEREWITHQEAKTL